MGLLSWLRGKKSGGASADGTAPEGSRESESSGAQADDLDPNDSDASDPMARASAAELGARLESKDGGARIDAARELLDRWRALDAEAAHALAPRLDALLEDPEPVLRQVALSGVRMMRKPENLARVQSAVLARLADPVSMVRTAAVWAAAWLPGDVPREQVRAQLASQEETMRFAAARALADRRDAAALPVLIAALDEGHLRQEALTSLMSLGEAGAAPAIAAQFERGAEGIEGLGDPFDQTMIAAALARFGDPRGAQHLVARIEAAEDDQPVAAEWAGRVGAKEAIPALREAAGDPGSLARGAALRALGRLQAEGAWELLRGLAGDATADEDLRSDAAEGLAELNTPEALELLRSLAKARDGLGKLCAELLFELEANAAKPADPAAVDQNGQSGSVDQAARNG